MSSESHNDKTAQNIAVASVRRHSMTPDQWEHTVIGCVHPKLASSLDFLPGELPIASGFFSQTSWWLISTQRVVSQHDGERRELDPRYGIEHVFGNFKGIKSSDSPRAPKTEVATVTSQKTRECVSFEFETGRASMAPIYACMFWSRVTAFHHGGRDAQPCTLADGFAVR